jgi:DNA-binding CsgD family transcriptional regulator
MMPMPAPPTDRPTTAGEAAADITDREREVLALLATGRTQSVIARHLVVAPGDRQGAR